MLLNSSKAKEHTTASDLLHNTISYQTRQTTNSNATIYEAFNN